VIFLGRKVLSVAIAPNFQEAEFAQSFELLLDGSNRKPAPSADLAQMERLAIEPE